jgi:hypothetical protein
MERLRIGVGLAFIGMLAAACAKVSAPSIQGPSVTGPGPSASVLGPPLNYAGSLTIGPQDSGKTVLLGAGNTLVFSTGPEAFPSSVAWDVASSPAGYLIPSPRTDAPPFSFLARRAGVVVLTITVGPGCDSGLLGPSQTSCSTPASGAAGMPVRQFTYPVKVSPRGG